MKRVFRHLRIFIFRGILAVIPLGLTFFAVRLLYFTVDRRVAELVERRLGFEIPGLGILLAIVLLYLIGVVASNWVAREFFRPRNAVGPHPPDQDRLPRRKAADGRSLHS